MMAYFDTTRTLRRFDALGGASSLFYLTEDNALATVNKVEAGCNSHQNNPFHFPIVFS